MPARSRLEMEAGLDRVRQAPRASGELVLIVRRPQVEAREILARGRLELAEGLHGDCWSERGSSRTADGRASPDAQVTVMGARAAALISGSDDSQAWAPAGDQLFVDLDLSTANLPAGTRLAIADAVLEVTAEPHLGCGKFARRFGVDALKLVNADVGRELRLRGLNARVVEPGEIAVGDSVQVVAGSAGGV